MGPRNGLAAAWLREEQRRRRWRAKPGWAWRQTVGALALVLALFGLSAWLGGFSAAGRAAAVEVLHAALVATGFTIDQIEVRGARRVDAAEAAAALALAPGGLIFGFDPEAAQARVEQLAWVESASVMRLMPDRVVVLIDERRPLALWETPAGAVVLDLEGRVIDGADPAEFAGLPRLEGEDAPASAGELVDALARHPELARRARVFERIAGRRWDVRFEGGLVVQLPEGRAAAALADLAELEAREGVLDLPIEALDLRGEDLVMRPRPLPPGFERGA
jgi:cell division protein FtsQ